MGVVLVFDTRARADIAARLHSEGCALARECSGVVVVYSDVEHEAAELSRRGFAVKRCKCCDCDVTTKFAVVDAKTRRPFTRETWTTRELADVWRRWAKASGLLRGRPSEVIEVSP